MKFIVTVLASIFIAFCNCMHVMAQPKDILLDGSSKEFIELPGGKKDGIVDFLGFIQTVLLKLVLPLVAIGTALYIAYILFTAE